jgi:hypothetical protein
MILAILIHAILFLAFWLTNLPYQKSLNAFLAGATGLRVNFLLFFMIFAGLVGLLAAWLYFSKVGLRKRGCLQGIRGWQDSAISIFPLGSKEHHNSFAIERFPSVQSWLLLVGFLYGYVIRPSDGASIPKGRGRDPQSTPIKLGQAGTRSPKRFHLVLLRAARFNFV